MKFNSLLFFGIFIILLSSSFLSTDSYELRWTVIGHNTVDFRNDKGQLFHRLPDSLFTQIRLGFQGGDISMHHCTIHFADGEIQTVPLRKKFNAGSMSKVIDLSGGKRSITKVVYFYTPSHLAKKKTTIELWTKIDTGE